MNMQLVASPNFDLRIKDLNNNQLLAVAFEIKVKFDQCNEELRSRVPSLMEAAALAGLKEVG
jgi:hypothetical protein